tara:strand:+ start:1741 stop:2289 length:549 start_codon:yes stop_codon:yes gene_type:complete
MEVQQYWSEIHNAYLTSHNTIERFKRDKDILKEEKEKAEKGYKQNIYVWSIHLQRTSWILLRNPYYSQTINALNRGKGPLYEKVIETYKGGINQVPFYSAIKKGKKIGNFFLREDINGESFLFMPKYGGLNKRNSNNVIPTSIGKDGKKNYRLDVSNDYYIFDIAKNGNIINHAKLWYRKRS